MIDQFFMAEGLLFYCIPGLIEIIYRVFQKYRNV